MTYLDYASRGRNAGWRYVLALVLGFIFAIVVGGVALLPLQLGGILSKDWLGAAQDPGQPVFFFLFNGAVFGLLLLGVALAAWWVQKKRPTDLLGWWSWRLFGLGGAIWLVALTAAALIDFAIAPSGFRFSAGPGTPQLALAALAGLAFQTFAEEYIFRGHITQGLMLAIRKPLPAALLSGLIFGAVHIPNGAPQAASATVFGVIMAMIAIRTRGIAFTSGLHLVNNVFGAVVLVSAGDAFRGSPGLFSQDTPHLMWWDMAVGSLALVVVALLIRGARWLPQPAVPAQNAA
jgi:membrane protease YdiL (CAAX protease family)